MLNIPTIQQIATTSDAAHAFRLQGKIRVEDLEAMARHMDAAIDQSNQVDMLLLLQEFDGNEIGTLANLQTMRTMLRSSVLMRRYAMV